MHITTKIWQKERSCIKITRRKRKRIDQLIKVMGNVHNYAPSGMKNRINAGVFSLLFRLIKTSLPKSRLLSCFPFLLKKLRFLHDIHLPKFMTAIQTLQIYTHTQWRKRKRKTSNPEQEDKVVAAALVVGVWVSERTRKKKKRERGSGGVTAFIDDAGWVYVGCRVGHSVTTYKCSHTQGWEKTTSEKNRSLIK